MSFDLKNQENLEHLMRLIRRAVEAHRFALIFANCSSLTDQNRYIEELQRLCSEAEITLTTVELWSREPIKNLRLVIQEHLKQNFQNGLPVWLAIQITGLELSILLDADEAFPVVLQTLNIGRESYRVELPYPLLIWLPDYAYIKLANIAPDFWSVRDGSFMFLSKEKVDQLYNLDQIILEKKDITRWRDKTDQIPVIERILESESREIPTEISIDLRLKLGDAYYFIRKLGRARECFEKALQLSQEVEDIEREGTALNGLGLIYTDLNEFPKAIECFERYLELRERQGKRDAQAVGYNHLGFVYDKQGEHEQAIVFYQKALVINKEFGKREAEGDVLGNLGLAYRKLQQFEKAIHSHEEALKISRELGNPQSEVKDIGNIGLVYHARGDYKQAINYYKQALELSQRIGNKQNELDQQFNLGDAWRDLNEFNQAVESYTEALKLAKEIGSEKLHITALEKVADMYDPTRLGNLDQQIVWMGKFIERNEESEDPENHRHCAEKLIGMCRIQDLGSKKREWLVKAESFLKKWFKESEASTSSEMTFDNHMITICKGLLHDEEAKKYQQRLSELKQARQISIWLEPGLVEVENGKPILQIQQPYLFQIQIGSPIAEYSWIYHEDFQKMEPDGKVTDTVREGFKSSTETPEKVEDKIQKHPSPTTSEKPASDVPKIQPKKPKEKLKPIRSPSPKFPKNRKRKDTGGTYLSKHKDTGATSLSKRDDIGSTSLSKKIRARNEFASITTASFEFHGDTVSFDAPKQDLPLWERQDSDILYLTVIPEKVGEHRIRINVTTSDHKFEDQFEISLRAVEKATRQARSEARSILDSMDTRSTLSYLSGKTANRILIVEDEPGVIELLAVSLEDEGYIVSIATDGEQGLKKVEEEKPDLIISNVMMPVMDGYEFCKRLHENPETASIPFIFLTARKDVSDRVRGLYLGADDYISKPFHVVEVVARVKALMQRFQRSRAASLQLLFPETEAAFAGSLGTFSIEEVFQIIIRTRKNGCLFVTNSSWHGEVYFYEGMVTYAAVDRKKGEEAVYRLLSWKNGQFKFEVGVIARTQNVQKTAESLLEEGKRQLDEYTRLLTYFPSMETHLEVLSLIEGDLSPEELQVLNYVNHYSTLMKVIDHSKFGDLKTLQILVKLHSENIIGINSDEAYESLESMNYDQLSEALFE